MKIAMRLAMLAAALLLCPAGRTWAAGPVRADPGCVAKNLRIPKELAPHLPDRAYLRYEVTAEGQVTRLEVAPEVASKHLTKQLKASLAKCRAASAPVTPPGQYALALSFEK
jgi:DNA-binding transcriptional regulator YdaS (Cro superfamily)